MAKNSRLMVFAQLMGLAPKRAYLSSVADVVLHLVKMCFAKFSAATFRVKKCVPRPVHRYLASGSLTRLRVCVFALHRIGQCLVLLQDMIDAVEQVFPVISAREPGHVWKGHFKAMSEDLFYGLVAHITGLAFKYEDLDAVRAGNGEDDDSDAPTGAGGGNGGNAATKRRRRSSGAKKLDEEVQFQPIDFVVDFDEALELCLKAFWDQTHRNQVRARACHVLTSWQPAAYHTRDRWVMQEGLRVVYDKYDSDKNGVLSLDEFTTVVGACTNHALPHKRIMAMFKELTGVNADHDADDEHVVTAEAFATLANKYGIIPPLDTDTTTGDGKPHRGRRKSSTKLSVEALQHLRAVAAGKESTPVWELFTAGAAATEPSAPAGPAARLVSTDSGKGLVPSDSVHSMAAEAARLQAARGGSDSPAPVFRAPTSSGAFSRLATN